MRLGQISNEVPLEGDETKLPNDEVVESLKIIMHDLHKTLLTADTLMRKLEGIIDKT